MSEQYSTPEELEEQAEAKSHLVEPHPDAEPGELEGAPTDVAADGIIDDNDGVSDSRWPDEVQSTENGAI